MIFTNVMNFKLNNQAAFQKTTKTYVVGTQKNV